jgi:hypothetical protein
MLPPNLARDTYDNSDANDTAKARPLSERHPCLHRGPEAAVLSLGEELVPDVARRGRKSGTAGLSPSGLVDLMFVANH